MNEEITRSPRLPLSRKASAVEVAPPSSLNSNGRRIPTQRSLSFSDREENYQQPSRTLVPPPVLPRRQCK